MNKFQNIFFDFDGTLAGTKAARQASYVYAIQNHQAEIVDAGHNYDQILSTVQNSKSFHELSDLVKARIPNADLYDEFAELLRLNLNRAEIPELLGNLVSSHQSAGQAVFLPELIYPGVTGLLESLKARGFRLFVTTNNKAENVEFTFRNHLDLFE